MAEGGASAASLGHVAINFPAVVAANLEPVAQTPTLDIEAIVRMTVDQVLGRDGVEETHLRDRQVRGSRGLSRIKKNVTVNGKKTSIKVPAQLFQQFEHLAGKETDRLLQGYAGEAPEGHPNRSAWVERQLTHYVVLAEVQPEVQGRH